MGGGCVCGENASFQILQISGIYVALYEEGLENEEGKDFCHNFDACLNPRNNFTESTWLF